jgi:GNAT superfamily N-acetyltransferase
MNLNSEILDFISKWKKQAVTLRISIVDNDLRLDLISVHKSKRNKGLGTTVMNELAQLADRYQKKIHLKPDPFSPNTDRLYRFYDGLGYKYSNFRGEMTKESNKL